MIYLHLLLFWLLGTADTQHPMVQEALLTLGSPYVAGSLENPKEDFVCRTDAFDCFTLVEYCTAKALMKPNSTPYPTLIEQNRYRGGKRNGYGSRHHYFVSWAQAGVQNGWLAPVHHPDEQPWKKKINYMSTHRGAYPTYIPIKEWMAIQHQENELSEKTLHFFPKENLPIDLNFIQNGDIIAFTSQVAGLDVNHEGIAFWQNNQLHFIHASQELKKVVISEETLGAYLRRIKKHSGLMIYRIKL